MSIEQINKSVSTGENRHCVRDERMGDIYNASWMFFTGDKTKAIYFLFNEKKQAVRPLSILQFAMEPTYWRKGLARVTWLPWQHSPTGEMDRLGGFNPMSMGFLCSLSFGLESQRRQPSPHAHTHSVYISVAIVKCRLYYYSCMVRPIDQETTAIEKVACYTLRSQEEGARHAMRATQGSPKVSQNVGGQVSVGKSLHCGFCRKEQTRKGNHAWD